MSTEIPLGGVPEKGVPAKRELPEIPPKRGTNVSSQIKAKRVSESDTIKKTSKEFEEFKEEWEEEEWNEIVAEIDNLQKGLQTVTSTPTAPKPTAAPLPSIDGKEDNISSPSVTTSEVVQETVTEAKRNIVESTAAKIQEIPVTSSPSPMPQPLPKTTPPASPSSVSTPSAKPLVSQEKYPDACQVPPQLTQQGILKEKKEFAVPTKIAPALREDSTVTEPSKPNKSKIKAVTKFIKKSFMKKFKVPNEPLENKYASQEMKKKSQMELKKGLMSFTTKNFLKERMVPNNPLQNKYAKKDIKAMSQEEIRGQSEEVSVKPPKSSVHPMQMPKTTRIDKPGSKEKIKSEARVTQPKEKTISFDKCLTFIGKATPMSESEMKTMVEEWTSQQRQTMLDTICEHYKPIIAIEKTAIEKDRIYKEFSNKLLRIIIKIEMQSETPSIDFNKFIENYDFAINNSSKLDSITYNKLASFLFEKIDKNTLLKFIKTVITHEFNAKTSDTADKANTTFRGDNLVTKLIKKLIINEFETIQFDKKLNKCIADWRKANPGDLNIDKLKNLMDGISDLINQSSKDNLKPIIKTLFDAASTDEHITMIQRDLYLRVFSPLIQAGLQLAEPVTQDKDSKDVQAGLRNLVTLLLEISNLGERATTGQMGYKNLAAAIAKITSAHQTKEDKTGAAEYFNPQDRDVKEIKNQINSWFVALGGKQVSVKQAIDGQDQSLIESTSPQVQPKKTPPPKPTSASPEITEEDKKLLAKGREYWEKRRTEQVLSQLETKVRQFGGEATPQPIEKPVSKPKKADVNLADPKQIFQGSNPKLNYPNDLKKEREAFIKALRSLPQKEEINKIPPKDKEKLLKQLSLLEKNPNDDNLEKFAKNFLLSVTNKQVRELLAEANICGQNFRLAKASHELKNIDKLNASKMKLKQSDEEEKFSKVSPELHKKLLNKLDVSPQAFAKYVTKLAKDKNLEREMESDSDLKEALQLATAYTLLMKIESTLKKKWINDNFDNFSEALVESIPNAPLTHLKSTYSLPVKKDLNNNGLLLGADDTIKYKDEEAIHVEREGQSIILKKITSAVINGRKLQFSNAYYDFASRRIYVDPDDARYHDYVMVSDDNKKPPVITLCDGSGHGIGALPTAMKTAQKAHAEIAKSISRCGDVHSVLRAQLKALKTASDEVRKGALAEPGSTTFIQTAVVGDTLTGVVLGDSKVFIFRPKDGGWEAIDPLGNLKGTLDATDSGGQVVTSSTDFSDFQQVHAFTYSLRDGDVVYVCSDGVVDNFDPSTSLSRDSPIKPDEWLDEDPNHINISLKEAKSKMEEVIKDCKDGRQIANSIGKYIEKITKDKKIAFARAKPDEGEKIKRIDQGMAGKLDDAGSAFYEHKTK